VDRRPASPIYAFVGVRALVAGGLATALVAGRSPELPLVGLVVIATLAFDRHHLVTLRNFVLVYTVVVFGLGTAAFHYAPSSIVPDVVAYLLAFLSGYAVASGGILGSADREAPAPGAPTVVAGDGERGPLNRRAVEAAIVALVALNIAFLAFQLEKYGIGAYYRGQALLDQFLSYGQASPTGGAEQIGRFLLKFCGIGLVILYAQACYEARARVRYRYPIGLLVALPILSLRRYDAVVGALTALAVYACERRVAGRRGQAQGFRVTRTVALAAAMASAVLAALAIGVLRQGFVDPGAGAPDAGNLPVLTSELSPVRAYDDITTNIGVLGYPRGRTIVVPLLLKVVPRAWFPDKPLNSAAYYLSIVRPGELAAGYAVPPTFYGDAYLNFGFGGALVACLLLGVVAARLDRAYKRPVLTRIPFFLILWASAFSLMRDPMSESLAGVLLTLGVWFVADHLLRHRASAPARGAVAPSVPAAAGATGGVR